MTDKLIRIGSRKKMKAEEKRLNKNSVNGIKVFATPLPIHDDDGYHIGYDYDAAQFIHFVPHPLFSESQNTKG